MNHKNPLIRSLAILITLFCLGFSEHTLSLNLERYDADVAALLAEYQADSFTTQTSSPSRMVFQHTAETYTSVDFKRGMIFVESASKDNLKQAIVAVLLTQINPNIIDAATAQDFGLVGKNKRPFFWNQIHDHEGKAIAYPWRAQRFAEHLIQHSQLRQKRYRVVIPMVKKHQQIAANKYRHLAEQAARRHGIPTDIIMAIMETESSFNPRAKSRSNALGLMQIKASTAGRDYFSLIKGVKKTPSSRYLYDPAQNIEVATGYLKILSSRYLAGINDAKKREYAMISSYNGGAGNLWLSLDKKGHREKALARINAMNVNEFYWFLTHRHQREETRNYLKKVSRRQAKYR